MKMSTSKKKSNIPWKGALNIHLVSILGKEYSKFVAPPSGQSKKSICAGWGRILGVGGGGPISERAKQNVDKLICLWKQKCNSTGFGNLLKNDRTILTIQDQLLTICDAFFELDPIMSNRRIIAPKGGILKGGVPGWSQTQALATSSNNTMANRPTT